LVFFSVALLTPTLAAKDTLPLGATALALEAALALATTGADTIIWVAVKADISVVLAKGAWDEPPWRRGCQRLRPSAPF
jgi:hypothetical protein